MKKLTKWALLALVTLICAACMMSPEQQQTALQVVDQMLAQGSISQVQADALRETILNGGQGAWWLHLADTLGGAVLGYLGVQIRRGAPTQRVGLPATLVRPVVDKAVAT